MLRTIQVFALVGVFALSSSAESLPPVALERWLLPITVVDVPGAYGTHWTSELWMKIDTTQPYLVAPFFGPSACDPPCPEPGGPPDDAAFELGFYRTNAGELPGSLLYVASDVADAVHASLRLRETSRGMTIQLPVVREAAFSVDRVQILGVPVGANSRAILRIYGIDPERTGNVRVRIFSEASNTLLRETTLALHVAPKDHIAGPYVYPIRPAYAQLELSGPEDVLRVELSSETEDVRIWAFVSITDNRTQAVTLRTP